MSRVKKDFSKTILYYNYSRKWKYTEIMYVFALCPGLKGTIKNLLHIPKHSKNCVPRNPVRLYFISRVKRVFQKMRPQKSYTSILYLWTQVKGTIKKAIPELFHILIYSKNCAHRNLVHLYCISRVNKD